MRLSEAEFARLTKKRRDTLLKVQAPTEQQEQEAVIVWAQAARAQYPAPPTSGRIESPSAVYLPLVLGLERSMQKGAGHDR